MGCANTTGVKPGRSSSFSFKRSSETEMMFAREISHLNQFCQILNNIHDGIIIKSATTHETLFANEAAGNILGFSIDK